MQIVAFLLVAFIVGAFARLFMLVVPGKDPPGLLITTVLTGIGGSLLARAFDWTIDGRAPPIVASVIAAMMLLVVYRMVSHRFLARREVV